MLLPADIETMAAALSAALLQTPCTVIGKGKQRLETAFGYEHLETRRSYLCCIVDRSSERRAQQGDTLRARADVEILLLVDAEVFPGDRIETNDAIFDVIETNAALSLQPCKRIWAVKV